MSEAESHKAGQAPGDKDPATLVSEACQALDTAADRLANLATAAEQKNAKKKLTDRKDRIALLGEEVRDIRGRVDDLAADVS